MDVNVDVVGVIVGELRSGIAARRFHIRDVGRAKAGIHECGIGVVIEVNGQRAGLFHRHYCQEQ